MNDNTIDSIEWHRNQLSKLLSGEDDFGKVESELDSILEKAKSKKKILVRRAGKTFYREQEVGRKEPEKKVGNDKKGTFDRKEFEEHEKKLNEKLSKTNEYGISLRDISEGDYVDMGRYGKGFLVNAVSDTHFWMVRDKKDRYDTNASGHTISIEDIEEILDADDIGGDDDDTEMYKPRDRND